MRKRLLSIILSLCMIMTMLPVYALADDEPPMQVLLIGNSHSGDMTVWTNQILKDAGLSNQIEITRLSPMGGRKLFTDDTARSSHIAAATWAGTDEEWNAGHQGNGSDVGSKTSQYNDCLNNPNKLWDLIIVQDWEESTINSDANQTASGIQNAVKWLRESNYASVSAGTKIAWAADWPDAANHEKAQANMTNAIESVNALSEDGVDFIIPTGLTVENARTSYFDQVYNAEDSYLPGSEETYGGIAAVSKYHLMERDANHLSYELGCYTVAATMIAEIASQYNLMDVDDFLASLKTAPNWNNPAEWKGEFNESIWNVVKESVKNAVEHPTQVITSKYTVDPADTIANKILQADYSEASSDAATVTSQEELSQIAEDIKKIANKAAGDDVVLTASSTYQAAIDGTEDNKTGTAGKYEICISFLNGYTQKQLAVISGSIKPTYYEGGETELASAKAVATADLTKTAELVGANIDKYTVQIDSAYTTDAVSTALANAKKAVVSDAGYLYADWIGDQGWSVDSKMPVGEDTGVRFTIRKEGSDTTLIFSGVGTIPDLYNKTDTTKYSSAPWMDSSIAGQITKVVIGNNISLGHMSLWLGNVTNMEIGEEVTLPLNAIYLNGQNRDRSITFKGAATVCPRSIDGYTGTDGKGGQATHNAQIFVYADFSKLNVTRAEDFVGSDILRNNNYGLPIVVVTNTGSSTVPSDVEILEQGVVPENGWTNDGAPDGNASGVTYSIKRENGDIVLEFSGSGNIPNFTTGTPNCANTPWRKKYLSSISKVVVNNGITVGSLAIFLGYEKEITLADGVTLNQNAIYFNTQNVDCTITFEGTATVTRGSISWNNQSGQKNLAAQILVEADFSKLTQKNQTVTAASDFISGDLLTTNNKNGLPIAVAIDTGNQKEDAQEYSITNGGWDEKGNTLGEETGVSYKIYNSGLDTIVEFTGTGTMPDYWAAGNGDPALQTNRMPWRNANATKIIVGDGVNPGQMSLFLQSTVKEVVFEGNVNLKTNTVYINPLHQNIKIFFNGTQTTLRKGALDGYNLQNNVNHITVYAKSNTLYVGNTVVTAIDQFAGSGVLVLNTDNTTIAQLVLDNLVAAAERLIKTDETIKIHEACNHDTEDDKIAAVKSYIRTKLGSDYQSVTVDVKKVAASIYTITFTQDTQSTHFNLKFAFDFSHQWTYTANGATITATCAHCKSMQAARLLVSDAKETGHEIAATVSYGNAWPSGELTISYTQDGSAVDGTPKNAGTYVATIKILDAIATAKYTISHILTHQDSIAATCDSNGIEEYYTCTVCGKNFSDAEGMHEIADLDAWKLDDGKIDASGHSYGEPTYNWSDDRKTCTAEKVCSKCNDRVTEEATITSAVKNAATCTEKGTTTYTATFTTEGFSSQSEDIQDIPMIEHDWSNNDGVCKVCKTECSETHKPGTTCTVCHKYTPASSSGGHSSSSTSTTNTVSAPSAPNGKVSLDKSSAKKGDKVTITITPDEGYKLDKLTVTDAKGKTIAVTKNSDNKYTFTMPDSKVSVDVSYVKADATTEQPSDSKNFIDVSSSDWYADAVQYVTEKGLMNGTGDSRFSPADSTTRGMLMTILARYAGEDTTGGATWYEKGMNWAKANGVSDGTNPNANITREQLVTMLYRYAGSPAANGALTGFSDAANVSNYAVTAMQWAVANGIVNGSNGKLNPQDNATRAEVAAILMRFCEMSK